MRIPGFVALVLVVCSQVACGSRSTAVEPDEAARLLVDRNWIDVMPRDAQDRLHVFRFTPSMGGGVFQDRTVFRGEFELFTFKLDGGSLQFWFPDRDERYRSGYTIERVAGPPPFDLKLTLDRSPRGPRIYYGTEAATGDLDTFLATAVR